MVILLDAGQKSVEDTGTGLTRGTNNTYLSHC